MATSDPQTAANLDQTNPARLLRAWEVLAATGTGLAEWHRRTEPALLPLDSTHAFALTPPRNWLHNRCDARFDAMLEAGALDEAARVMALGFDPTLPGMKPLGAPDLMAHLTGDLTLSDATTRAKTATRRYAKRQETWIRNQMFRWQVLDSHNPAENMAIATDYIKKPG